MGIFLDLLNGYLEIFMDDFTRYGDAFETTLVNLEKVLEWCVHTDVSMSTVICHMMMNEGIVLGHLTSTGRIKLQPIKTKVILKIPIPKTQKNVHSFLGHATCYRRFIEKISKIASPLFSLLTKDVEFV